MSEIRVPDGLIPAKVQLEGVDGNAFSIMAHVSKGLRKAGNPKAVIDGYMEQSMSGDYDHLLRVAMAYVDEDFDPDEDQDPDWMNP